jgi:hypothetical protein
MAQLYGFLKRVDGGGEVSSGFQHNSQIETKLG